MYYTVYCVLHRGRSIDSCSTHSVRCTTHAHLVALGHWTRDSILQSCHDLQRLEAHHSHVDSTDNTHSSRSTGSALTPSSPAHRVSMAGQDCRYISLINRHVHHQPTCPSPTDTPTTNRHAHHQPTRPPPTDTYFNVPLEIPKSGSCPSQHTLRPTL